MNLSSVAKNRRVEAEDSSTSLLTISPTNGTFIFTAAPDVPAFSNPFYARFTFQNRIGVPLFEYFFETKIWKEKHEYKQLVRNHRSPCAAARHASRGHALRLAGQSGTRSAL
jgi:hypothetical protein